MDRIAKDLQSEIPAVRCSAVRELARRGGGSVVVDTLMEVLSDEVPSVRREAVRALGKLEADRAAPAIAKLLADNDQTVRYFAAHALGELAVPATAESLVSALRDPQWGVRSEAAWALRELADPRVINRLEEASKEEGGLAIDQLVWILRDSHSDKLLEMLAGIGETGAVAARVEVVGWLGDLGGEEVVRLLTASLRDESPEVRSAAVGALLKAGDRRGLEALQAHARHEPDAKIKKNAAKAALMLSRHEGFVAHWSFDAGTGNRALDSGDNEIHGKINNCSRVEGKVGRALQFGKNSCVELGKPVDFPVAQAPFTVTAWVNTSEPHGVVVARGGAYCGFSLYVKDSVAKFGIHLTAEGESHIAAGTQNVTGKWIHLAGVVDQAAVRIYVDGRKAGEKKIPGLLPGNCGQSMEIGFDLGNSAAEITDHFVGTIDEVRVYCAALSAKDLAEIRLLGMDGGE